jgi:hypothetical protein
MSPSCLCQNAPLRFACQAESSRTSDDAVVAKCKFWHFVRMAESSAKDIGSGWATAVWMRGLAALAGVSVSRVRLGERSAIPIAANQHLPSGRLFTTEQWADYLIYAKPGRKVFFDGRNDFYGRAFVSSYLAVMAAQPGWQQTFERYGVTVALVPTGSPLSAALSCARWRKIYRDADAAVFAWQSGSGPERDQLLKPGCSRNLSLRLARIEACPNHPRKRRVPAMRLTILIQRHILIVLSR